MARKLYVGSLSFDTTDEQLRDEFAKFGAVESVAVIRDRYSDMSRGFGFVEMSNDSEAEKAIQALNGMLLDGRQIVVNYAKERQEGGPRGGGYRGGGGGGRRY
ncbi:RNA recognition motif domain-containing protein [Chloroflexota bacterium]